MKKLILILITSLFLSSYANAIEFNFVCRSDDDGKLDNYKELFELSDNKLVIDGQEFKLSSKPIITDTLISFETSYRDIFMKKMIFNNDEEKKNNTYYSDVVRLHKINKNSGLMVEKLSFVNWKNEDTIWIYYYQCEIF